MVAFVSGTIVYACYLTDEEAQKVRKYAEEHDTTLEEAVYELYTRCEINLYRDCDESDYYTEGVEQVKDGDEE